MKRREITASDRAVVAYLEFVWGANIEGLRGRIAKRAALAFKHDARAVVIDGLRFVRVDDQVITVEEKRSRRNCRIKRRRLKR